MRNYTEDDMNLTDFKTSMDNIFEISKFIYNTPKTPMDQDMMALITESLDYIKSFYNYTLYSQIQAMENLKAIAADPKSLKNSNIGVIEELNIEIEKLNNIYNICMEEI